MSVLYGMIIKCKEINMHQNHELYSLDKTHLLVNSEASPRQIYSHISIMTIRLIAETVTCLTIWLYNTRHKPSETVVICNDGMWLWTKPINENMDGINHILKNKQYTCNEHTDISRVSCQKGPICHA